jgi:antitoxin MazE
MKIPVIPIGNSKGIRIPKAILDQVQITEQVDLEVEENRILLTPVKEHPRGGWEEAFRRMHEAGEDHQIIEEERTEPAAAEFEWEW